MKLVGSAIARACITTVRFSWALTHDIFGSVEVVVFSITFMVSVDCFGHPSSIVCDKTYGNVMLLYFKQRVYGLRIALQGIMCQVVGFFFNKPLLTLILT